MSLPIFTDNSYAWPFIIHDLIYRDFIHGDHVCNDCRYHLARHQCQAFFMEVFL